MNRRNFLGRTTLIVTGVTLGLTFTPETIKNAVLYSPEELKTIKLFSLDVPSLERIIATGKLLTTKNPASLIELHEELSKNQPATSQIESREDELAEEVLRKSKEFSKKRPTKSYFHETTQKIDEMSSELQRLRERTEIDFIRQKRSIFGVTNDRQIEVRDSDLQELYVSDRCHSLALSFIEKAEQGSPLHRLSKTLKRISKDSQFIAYASTAGGVSLRKILGFIDIESQGREFAIGRDGEINRFQLHPRYLEDTYRNALSLGNELSDYIRENTSRRTLLENLSRDSKLNIALAVNFMKYLEKKTKEDYQSVIAYNRGLKRALNLSPTISKKLKNHRKITKKDLENYSVYRYYSNFLDAGKSFEQIRDHIVKESFS